MRIYNIYTYLQYVQEYNHQISVCVKETLCSSCTVLCGDSVHFTWEDFLIYHLNWPNVTTIMQPLYQTASLGIRKQIVLTFTFS